MMELDQEQYAKIARWLDGSPEPLTAAERVAADEIGDLERQVAGELRVALPDGAMFRLNAKLTGSVAPSPTRRLRLVVTAALAAAAVAMLAVGLSYLLRPTTPSPKRIAETPPKPASADPVSPVAVPWTQILAGSAAQSRWDVELDELGREMGELEAKSLVIASPVDVEMDALENDFNELLLDNAAAVLPGM